MDNNQINLNLLKFFLCAAESKSLSEVADKLGYNPSNVSVNISALEKQYGVRLFYRDPLKLTEIGKEIYETVRKGYRDIEFSEIIARNKNNIENGKISMGCVPHIINMISDKIMKAIKDYPKIQIQIDPNPSCTNLIEKLKDNLIQFAVLDFIPSKDELKNIKTIEICKSEYIFISKEKIIIKDMKELNKCKYILSYDNRKATLNLKKCLEEYGIEINSSIKCLDTNARINLAKTGVGIAYVMKEAAKKELEENKLHEVKIPIKLPSTTINLVYLENHLTNVDKKFIKDYLKINI